MECDFVVGVLTAVCPEKAIIPAPHRFAFHLFGPRRCLFVAQGFADRAREMIPTVNTLAEIGASGGGEFVELCFSVVVREAPFGIDQPLLLHAVQGWVK